MSQQVKSRPAPKQPPPRAADAPNGAANQRPVHEERMGRIVAAVWEHADAAGKVWFNVTFARIYKDADGRWARSDSFGRSDLPLLVKVADRCHDWMFRQSAEE